MGGSPDPNRLTREIRASGNLGLTVAQLARTLGTERDAIDGALIELARRQVVTRVGHGLWIDSTLHGAAERARGFLGPAHFLTQFESDAGIDSRHYTGEIQFRPNTEEPVHRWWPYVQGFSADFVRTVLRRYSIGRGARVFDPYAGSGTVLTVAREAGAEGLGTELMPISAFVARAKQLWNVEPDGLLRSADRILRRVAGTPPAPLPFLRETARQFDPGPLRTLRKLRAAVNDPDPDRRALLELAFARILVDSSRLRRSPCLGYGPKARVSSAAPLRQFRAAVQRTAADLTKLQSDRGSWGPAGIVREEDSRQVDLEPASVDLAVTSPPYANGMDYVMNYKLELAWLGFARSYGELRDLKARMVACDNLPSSEVLARVRARTLPADPWLAESLERIRDQLARKSSYRRGDMDRVVAAYFADLWPTLERTFRALRPGARYVVVNGDSLLAGVYVPSDLIFARMARAAGFVIESFELARHRRSGQRRDFRLRESVLTVRKPP